MENEDDTVTIEVNKEEVRHKLGKFVVVLVATGVAELLASGAYDKFVHRNRPIEDTIEIENT